MVAPLASLMEEQVASLRSRGIACEHSRKQIQPNVNHFLAPKFLMSFKTIQVKQVDELPWGD